MSFPSDDPFKDNEALYLGTAEFDTAAGVLLRNSSNGSWWLFKIDEFDAAAQVRLKIYSNDVWTHQKNADFDGDGDALLRRSDIGRWQIFRMQDGALVSSAPAGALFLSSSWEYQTSGDMDKDEVADVVLRHTGTGQWRVFKIVNRRVTGVQPLNLFTNLLWEHAQTGDFDGDGDHDLLLRRSDDGMWRFFNIANRRSVSNRAAAIWQKLNFEVQE